MPDRANPPLRIRLSAELGHRDFERICPGGATGPGRCAVDGCTFDVNPRGRTAADYWVVFGAAGPREVADVDPRNTLFVSCEPPSKKIYPRAYYAQFERVMSYRLEDPHPRVALSTTGLNWYAGLSFPENRYVTGHPELSAALWPTKQDRVSVICSDTATTPGQRTRLAFLAKMMAHFGERMVHFGKGFTPVSDKMEAITPYAYHLVLENDRHPHYWSEKLSDAYLGRAFPFYLGCPNLGDYFPEQGFAVVNPDDPAGAIAVMETAMDAGRAEAARAVVDACRDRVLNDYNPLVRIAAWARAFHTPGTARAVTVRSHRAFRRFPQNLLYRWKTRGAGAGTYAPAWGETSGC